MIITTKTSEETQKLAEKFANELKGGEILALVGELGSGKTTFAQGLAKGFGIKQRVISPTFIIMRSYPITQLPNSLITQMYHVDLYRLEGDLKREIKNLGLDDVWGKKEAIVLIEWADKAKDILPDDTIWISFQLIENGRKIEILDKNNKLLTRLSL